METSHEFDMEPSYTPLHRAAEIGQWKMVKTLLAKKADPNVASRCGMTPLHLSAWGGHKKIVQRLLKHNAYVDAKNGCMQTPLHLAAEMGHLEIAQILIYNGAAINAPDSDKWTPLALAAYHGNINVVAWLLHFNEINDWIYESYDTTTALFAAMRGARFEILKNKTIVAEKERLRVAEEIVRMLIRSGANVNHAVADALKLHVEKTEIPGCDNNSAGGVCSMLNALEVELFESVKRNGVDDVEALLTAGVNVDVKNSKGLTALNVAVLYGFEKIVSLLLIWRADPNIDGPGQQTPLQIAVKAGNIRIVTYLMNYGAVFDVNAKGGKAPMDLARRTGHKALIDLFLLVEGMFEKVRNNNEQALDDLNSIADDMTVGAVLRVQSKDLGTLLVTAEKYKFAKIHDLRSASREYKLLPMLNTIRKLMDEKKFDDAQKMVIDAYNVYDLDMTNYPMILALQSLIEVELLASADCVIPADTLPRLEKLYETLTNSYGPEDKDCLCTRSIIGRVLDLLGRHEEARTVLQEVYLKQKELLGADHFDTVASETRLAGLLIRLKHSEALKLYEYISNLHCSEFTPVETLMSVLHLAVGLGDPGLVKALLRTNDAYPTIADQNGDTALHYATSKKQTEIAELLLNDVSRKQLADYVNCQNSIGGMTALHVAAWEGSVPLVKLLLSKGASISIANRKGERPIDVARDASVRAILQLLDELFENVKAGKISVVEKLSSVEADEFEMLTKARIGYFGLTLFQVAKAHGQRKIAIRLLDLQQAPSQVPLREGFEKLLEAIEEENISQAEACVQSYQRTIFYLRDLEGNAALHHAVWKNDVRMVSQLLESGAVVDLVTKKARSSALHIAAANGLMDMVKLLLKHSAVYDAVNADGKTPRDLSSNRRVVGFLTMVDRLFLGAEQGDFEIVDVLRGLPLDDLLAVGRGCCKSGGCVVEVAFQRGHKKLARRVVEVLRKPLGKHLLGP